MLTGRYSNNNFLFGTTTTPSITFSNSHFFSGQSQHTSSPSILLYLWLGVRRPTAQSYDSSSVSRYYLGWPLHLLRGISAYKNLPCKAQRPKCCLYETPYYVAAPVRETGDIIAHLQEPELFWFTSNAFLKRPVLLKYWLLHPFSMRKPHAKAVPSKDYFTPMRTLIVTQRYDLPRDWLWDACHMAGVCWGSRCEGFCSKEGPHYRFEQSMRNLTINLIHKFGNPLGIPYPSCSALLSGAYVMQESVSSRIFLSKKGMIRVRPTDVCFRNLRQKAESVLLWKTNAFCAWNMGAHVRRTTS